MFSHGPCIQDANHGSAARWEGGPPQQAACTAGPHPSLPRTVLKLALFTDSMMVVASCWMVGMCAASSQFSPFDPAALRCLRTSAKLYGCTRSLLLLRGGPWRRAAWGVTLAA